jgi:hypothetical protein
LGTIQDIPSDVKTIAYYVYDPNSSMAVGDFRDAAGNTQTGLVRRALDRSVTLYASTNAGLTSVQSAGEIIAPEIAGIMFEYFDGIEWVYEWDSQQMEGLPLAVRITVVMLPPGAVASDVMASVYAGMGTSSGATATGGMGVMPVNTETYSLTVRLPTALPAETTVDETAGLEAVGL